MSNIEQIIDQLKKDGIVVDQFLPGDMRKGIPNKLMIGKLFITYRIGIRDGRFYGSYKISNKKGKLIKGNLNYQQLTDTLKRKLGLK